MGEQYNNAGKFNKVFKLGSLFDDEKLTNLNPCVDCETQKELLRIIDADYVVRYGDDPDKERKLSKNCESCLRKMEHTARCLSKLAVYENIDISTRRLSSRLKEVP